jgi:hypothetical protein
MKISVWPIVMCMSFISACTAVEFRMHLAPTKEAFGQWQTPIANHVRGEDCLSYLMLFTIPIPMGPGRFPSARIQRAVDRALEQHPGADLIVNASVRLAFYYYVFVARDCYQVTGDLIAVRAPRQSDLSGNGPQ